MPTSSLQARCATLKKFGCLLSAFGVLALSGCSSVAPSKTASNAGTGAVVGGLGGAVVGNNSGLGTGVGAVGGAALGAITGGIIGMVQDARDRKEQDRLSQERSYQQELAKRRAEDSKVKASMDEELAIAQGFRISDLELNDAKKKLESASDRLKRLQGERQAALARKKDLDDANEKTLTTEAEIARLEEELARLKGEELARPAGGEAPPQQPPAISPAVKPGT